MDILDVLFPEVAEAGHLREIANEMKLLRTSKESAQISGANNSRRIDWLNHKLNQLESDGEILKLVVLALVKALGDREQINILSLQKFMKDIDLADGVADGKVSIEAFRRIMGIEEPVLKDAGSMENNRICSGCYRPIHPNRESCIYCGGLMA